MTTQVLARETRSSHRGFTLMELLIVIVIIAVLMAIGFPFMRNMKERAENTECMNKLHNWGIAMGSYAGDNGGKINWEHWPSIGHDQSKASPYLPYWSGDDSNFESGFDTQLSQRYCPAVEWDHKGNEPVCYATIQPMGMKGVGISGRASGKSSDYALASITNLSRFMLMIDATGSGYSVQDSGDFNAKVKPLTVSGKDLRHNHKVNALFADFSVRSMTWPEIEKGLKYWTTF